VPPDKLLLAFVCLSTYLISRSWGRGPSSKAFFLPLHSYQTSPVVVSRSEPSDPTRHPAPLFRTATSSTTSFSSATSSAATTASATSIATARRTSTIRSATIPRSTTQTHTAVGRTNPSVVPVAPAQPPSCVWPPQAAVAAAGWLCFDEVVLVFILFFLEPKREESIVAFVCCFFLFFLLFVWVLRVPRWRRDRGCVFTRRRRRRRRRRSRDEMRDPRALDNGQRYGTYTVDTPSTPRDLMRVDHRIRARAGGRAHM